MSRGWQRNTRILHTQLLTLHARVCNTGYSTCRCPASRSPTTIWHSSPLHPPHTRTLGHPTPYLLSATYRLRSRRNVFSHLQRRFAELLSPYPDHTAEHTDGSFLLGQEGVLLYTTARHSTAFMALTASSPPKGMPCTGLLFSFAAYQNVTILSVQTL
jgi:hypothetical protein